MDESASASPSGEVVAAAIVREGRLLLARRAHPPALAGLWELPGGKVEPGETSAQALAREIDEELGLTVRGGDRIGVEVPLGGGLVLRAYRADLLAGEPRAVVHSAVMWVDRAGLASADLVPADTAWREELAALLR